VSGPLDLRGSIADIDEALCIGCLRCIDVCPVDAIVGARGRMHTVVAELCSGCGLCVEPCPVDCVSMRTLDDGERRWNAEDLAAADRRHDARLARLAAPAPSDGERRQPDRRRVIDEALERAAARRSSRGMDRP
jgi:electron transport complex protein RnfB